MKTLLLTQFTGDWATVIQEVEQTGVPVALEFNGLVCGVLLPTSQAPQVIARVRAQAKPQQAQGKQADPQLSGLRNYLELLRDDPTLLPTADGEPLEFMTMMNSSFVDPEQIYQFRHPQTHEIYSYRLSELQQAIGQLFSRVEFLPTRPKDFVERKSS